MTDGARISRLPPALRPAARRLRAAVPARVLNRMRPGFVFDSDGMATAHFSPFLDDGQFNDAYRRIAHRWPGGTRDIRWRVWLLVQCARQAAAVEGGFAEFGVYRGATAYMVLSQLGPALGDRPLYLFDTFSGIPSDRLTPGEVDAGLDGTLADTSVEEVRRLLDPWSPNVRLVAGDVLETLPATETGPLAWAHLDLNAAAPTRAALDYVYPRLVRSGVVVFDDYGWRGYEAQRVAIDDFLTSRPETLVPLPTGQALLVKT